MPIANDPTSGFQLSALPQPYSLPSNVGKVDVGGLQQAYANSLKNAQATALVGPETAAAISQAKYQQAKNAQLTNLLDPQEQAALASFNVQRAQSANTLAQTKGAEPFQGKIGYSSAEAEAKRAALAAASPYGVGMGSTNINGMQLPFTVDQSGRVNQLFSGGIGTAILNAPKQGTEQEVVGPPEADPVTGTMTQRVQDRQRTGMGKVVYLGKPYSISLNGNPYDVGTIIGGASQQTQVPAQIAPTGTALGTIPLQGSPNVPTGGQALNSFLFPQAPTPAQPEATSPEDNIEATAEPEEPAAPTAPTAPAAPTAPTAPVNIPTVSTQATQSAQVAQPAQPKVSVPWYPDRELDVNDPNAKAFSDFQKIAPLYKGSVTTGNAQKESIKLLAENSNVINQASDQAVALDHLSDAFNRMQSQGVKSGTLGTFINADLRSAIGNAFGIQLDGGQDIAGAARTLVDKLGTNNKLRAYAGINELIVKAKPNESDSPEVFAHKMSMIAQFIRLAGDRASAMNYGLSQGIPLSKVFTTVDNDYRITPNAQKSESANTGNFETFATQYLNDHPNATDNEIYTKFNSKK